jgi:hypothetical protein
MSTPALPVSPISPVSPHRLESHLRRLAVDIGVRLAGTPGERAAGDHCADVLREAGAAVRREPFGVRSRDVTSQELEIKIGGRWATFACSLFSNTPGTGGATLEAPLVFFEAPSDAKRLDLAELSGKAVVHLGCHIESRDFYRRLMEAHPAFLLLVDVRYPGTVPLADGMFPSYTRALGAVPTVNVAYQDAWRWKVEGAPVARLSVDGGMRPGESENVVAEFPGSGDSSEIIYLSAHHDTQADSVGADDNASGVAGILELARALAPLPRRRTLRIVSFGAEEQLSVGSARHVRAHRGEIESRGALAFNLDSFGSHLGWTEMILNGPPELEAYAPGFFEDRRLPVRVLPSICPYADHFPFVAAGVAGVTLWRMNCTAGRFFHHRPDDDLTRVSPELMARHLDAVAALVADLLVAPCLPFPQRIPQSQAEEARRFWVDLFGGWEETAA